MKCPGFGLFELLKDKDILLGVEIGCDEGITSEFLVKNLPQLFLHSIDPYDEYIDWNGSTVRSRNDVYINTINKMTKYDNFKLHKISSDYAFSEFEDDSLDFIFIDGIHTYDQVLKDCKNYYSKVKSSGIFAGHDFNMIPNVRQAVIDFANIVNKQIQLTEVDVWYWYK